MKFNSTRNKFLSDFKNSKINNNSIDKLSVISLFSNYASFNKKQNEIVLADKQSILNVAWQGTYQFNNLNSDMLNFLKPFAFLETSQGYAEETSWVYDFYYWWEQFNSTTILKMKASGYLLIKNKETGVVGSDIAPIYVTAKIKILNPKIYIEIIKSKS